MIKKTFPTPWGFSVKETTIREIDRRLKKAPDLKPTRKTVAPTMEVRGRGDVSIIASEDIDLDAEVLLLEKMDVRQFQKNPLVFWNHEYDSPSIGFSPWQKLENQAGRNVLIAQTNYAERKSVRAGEWFPDVVFDLVSHDPCLLPYKSIGFLSTKRTPTLDELTAHPEWKGFTICDDALWLEYSVVGLPANLNCTVQQVTKKLTTNPDILKRLGISIEPVTVSVPTVRRVKKKATVDPRLLEEAVARRLESIDVAAIVRQAIASRR